MSQTNLNPRYVGRITHTWKMLTFVRRNAALQGNDSQLGGDTGLRGPVDG